MKEGFNSERGLFVASASNQLYPNPAGAGGGEEGVQIPSWEGRIGFVSTLVPNLHTSPLPQPPTLPRLLNLNGHPPPPPAAFSVAEDAPRLLEFMGRMLGKAVYEGILVELQFAGGGEGGGSVLLQPI